MSSKIIGRGAEAILIKEENSLVKDRIKKGYRLAFLDNKLRTSRTKREAKLLEKASFLISVPKIISSDEKEKIEMQFIEGKKLSDWLDKSENAEEVCEKIGKSVAKLHDSDIIHGDLTTSNMIYVENLNNASNDNKTYNKESNLLKNYHKELINNKKNNISSEASDHRANEASENNFKVFFIDFGLGFHSKRVEDKAVDLHLLRQALEAKHFLHWQSFFSAVLKGYNSKDKDKILQQLKKVEARGRYKKH